MDTIMKAPPSTAFRIVDVPEAYRSVIDARGMKGTFVGPEESESPWVPFGDNAAIKHLAFDVRQNIYSNILWIKGPGVIGTHKHRGKIVMVPGRQRPFEYDWGRRPAHSSRRCRVKPTPWSPSIPKASSCSAGCRAQSSFTTRTPISSKRPMSAVHEPL